MVAVVVFEFSVMRCQPLRRALGAFLQMLDQSLRTTASND
ncbi:acetyltransferase [Vibrio cholerae]|nr:acetyltransferase [Vibrio cholerae]